MLATLAAYAFLCYTPLSAFSLFPPQPDDCERVHPTQRLRIKGQSTIYSDLLVTADGRFIHKSAFVMDVQMQSFQGVD